MRASTFYIPQRSSVNSPLPLNWRLFYFTLTCLFASLLYTPIQFCVTHRWGLTSLFRMRMTCQSTRDYRFFYSLCDICWELNAGSFRPFNPEFFSAFVRHLRSDKRQFPAAPYRWNICRTMPYSMYNVTKNDSSDIIWFHFIFFMMFAFGKITLHEQ